jgi:hypothetical protein
MIRFQIRPLVIGGALVAGFAGGAYVGHRSIPARVVTKQIDHIVYRDREVKVAAKTETRAAQTHTVRTRVTKPDGTKTETLTVDRGEQVAKAETTHTTKTADRAETHERKTVTERRDPEWRVSGLVGLDVRHILTPGPLVYGAAVEHRLFGPVWVGAWGLTNGTAGLSLGVTF